jgi:START domain-containing protein
VRALLILLVAVSLGDIDAKDGWKTWATKDGVTLERRPVEGSKYYEHRAFVDVAMAPARVADEIWASMRAGDMESLKHRDILSARDDELVIYDQIRTPVVSDRDYTVVITRRRVGERIEFHCDTDNGRGPPPQKGYARIPLVRAGWTVEPDGHGGTRLGYFAFSEPGGAVPAFLVRGPQAERSMADVIRMVKRLAAARK